MKTQYVIQNRETKLFYDGQSEGECSAPTLESAWMFDRIADARELLNWGGPDCEDIIRLDYTLTLTTLNLSALVKEVPS